MDIPTSTVAIFLNSPIDWPLLGLLAAILALESFTSGSTRTGAISISFPISYLVTGWLPSTFLFESIMPQLSTVEAQSAIFALVFIGLYLVTHRMLFSFGSSGGDVPQSIISGVATAIVVAVFWIQTPGLMDLWQFGPQVQLVFGDSFRAWWLVGAFGALAYTRG